MAASTLYHVSSLRWGGEDTLTLVPGVQCAEGRGVYFSEDEPRFSAAEGTQQAGAGAIFLISVSSPQGWWRSKRCNCRRRPRTWHTAGENIIISGLRKVGEINNTPVITGEWRIK